MITATTTVDGRPVLVALVSPEELRALNKGAVFAIEWNFDREGDVRGTAVFAPVTQETFDDASERPDVGKRYMDLVLHYMQTSGGLPELE